MDDRVLVTGASGYVGGRLVEALLHEGVPVRAMSRSPARLSHLQARGVEVVGGDVLDRTSLRTAMQGVRSAFYLVHSMGESRSSMTFEEYDRYAAQNFATEGSQLNRIIYLGGLGSPDDKLSPHLRSRHEVGDILSAGRAPTTVLKAGIVIGHGSVSFAMLVSLAGRLPVMICPRWVETRTQPIAIDDTVAYLMAALENSEASGRTFEIGGPDILSYKEMLRKTAALLGKRPLIVPVPVLTPALSAYWMDLVTPIPASIARPLIEGLRNEAIVRDTAAQDTMPLRRTPFEVAVKNALRQRASKA